MASAGPGLSDILWRIVCAGEGMRDAETALGWPARAGKLVLIGRFGARRIARWAWRSEMRSSRWTSTRSRIGRSTSRCRAG